MTSDTRRFLAVIPARGGSKRITRKNIRKFRGVPILGRTLSTVIAASIFDKVIVSTDDPEIARIGCSFGALVPFTRPNHLSDDWTGTGAVVAHAIDEATAKFGEFSAVCCVYPGAVLMTERDFVASGELVNHALKLDAVVSAVVRFGHPIQRALKRGEFGELVPAGSREELVVRTQDCEPMWHDAGQFYWASPDRWRCTEPLLTRVVPYELPRWRVQDIDTEDDWMRTELLYDSLLRAGTVTDHFGTSKKFAAATGAP